MEPETAAVEPLAVQTALDGDFVPVDDQLRRAIEERGMSLNPSARALIFQPGVTARPVGHFDIEAEGPESFFRYSLPDGRRLNEVIVGGFRLGLADASTGAVIEDTKW